MTFKTVEEWAEALKAPDLYLCYEAATLGELGPVALLALSEALRDPDADVRYRAAWVLWIIGSDAEAAVPALSVALKDPDDNVRFLAAEALARIGPAAVPALTEALRDPDNVVRLEAAWVLGRIGPAAAAAVPALAAMPRS